jgi:carboxyl-terminal processing protease
MRTIALVFTAVVSATVMWHGFNAASAGSNTFTDEQLNLLSDVFERIHSDFVDQPDDEKIIEAAVNGMLTSLDSHSTYIDANTFQEMLVQNQGKFGGLGIEGTMENGVIRVIAPIDDTPGARAGIMAGDLIIKIDGDNIQNMTMLEAVGRMRGMVNTEITLTILRDGEEPIDVKLIREEIRVRSVRSGVEGKDKDTGYIRISSFTEQTQDGLENAMFSLKRELGDKLKGYVIDLRNNPGGLLDQAVSVSDSFLNSGEVVLTRGRNADHTRSFSAYAGDLSDGKPLVVLINRGSASGSEIVAGALQDHKRATVIGTRSFGKGSVQSIYSLGRLGALRLTTAHYFTPSGRAIDGAGIDPDIIIEQERFFELNSQDKSTHGRTNLNGNLQNDAESEDGEVPSAYGPNDKSNDLQLTAAIDVLHGIEVSANDKPKKAKPTEGAGAGNSRGDAN